MTMTGRWTDDDTPRRTGAGIGTGDAGDGHAGQGGGFDDALEAAFGALRADRPQPSDVLMARLDADAAGVLPSSQAVSPPLPETRRMRPVARAASRDDVRRPVQPWQRRGGVLAGLMAAGVAGLWIGVAAPDPVLTLGAAMGLDLGATALADPEPLDMSYTSWALLDTLGES